MLQPTSDDDGVQLQHGKTLLHSSPRRGFNQRRTQRREQTIFLAEVWANPLPCAKHLVKSNHNWAKFNKDKSAQWFSLASAARHPELYGNFRAASPTISRVECVTGGDGVSSAPIQNQQQRTWNILSYEQGRQQDTGTCCCLLQPSAPGLHSGHLFTLQTGCKQGAVQAPRSWSGVLMPTGTDVGVTGVI